jgi:hypothetical protein
MLTLRIPLWAVVCWSFSTQAFAQITTIGPGTPAVTESIMTLKQTGVVNGSPFYSPMFTPIPLGSEAAQGFLGTASNFDMSTGCLQGCSAGPAESINPDFRLLDVGFSKPVSFASALQVSGTEMDIELWAYDRSNRLVGLCTGSILYPPPATNSECVKIVSGPNGPVPLFTGSYTIFDSTANISTVLIGGNGSDSSEVQSVTFSTKPVKEVSEPGAFALFMLALVGFAIASMRRVSACRSAL